MLADIFTKLLKQVPRNLLTRSCSFPFSTQIVMVGMFEENRIRAGIVNNCGNVNNGRKRHHE